MDNFVGILNGFTINVILIGGKQIKHVPKFMQKGNHLRGQGVSIIRADTQEARAARVGRSAFFANFENPGLNRKKGAFSVKGDQSIGSVTLDDFRHVRTSKNIHGTFVPAFQDKIVSMLIQLETQRSKGGRGIRILFLKPCPAGVLGTQDFENFFARTGNLLAGLAHGVQLHLHWIIRPGTRGARGTPWFARIHYWNWGGRIVA